MMWVTMALVAIVLGLILFSSIQDDIPNELAFLKGAPKTSQVATVATTPVQADVAGWLVQSRGAVTELSKRFAAGIKAGAYQYDAPVIGLMCDGKALHLRIDTQAPVTGRTESPVKVNGRESQWYKAQGTNVLAADAKSIAAQLLKAKTPVEFEFSYLDVGLAKASLDAAGLRDAAMQLPPACRF